MKKEGQPASPVEMTAGRKAVLFALYQGLANGEQMAMAANWLRDLYGGKANQLNFDALYQRLNQRKATDLADQQAAAARLENEIKNYSGPKANDRQVGGDHYRKAIQHWDFAAGHDYGYLSAQVTKYLFRHREKNGRQDLEKAGHFLDKLIEVEGQPEIEAPSIEEFLTANQVPEDEAYIMAMIHAFHMTQNTEFLGLARARMARLLQP